MINESVGTVIELGLAKESALLGKVPVGDLTRLSTCPIEA